TNAQVGPGDHHRSAIRNRADAAMAETALQIAAEGLAPTTQYQVYLAESDQPPFGNLEPLAVLKTNPDGAGIVQAIGPLKALAGISSSSSRPSRRFLIVTEIKDSSHVLLWQTRQSGKN